jgi:ribulose bisphosphate carboxylase small subunit
MNKQEEISDIELMNRLRYALHYGDTPKLEYVIEAEKRGLNWQVEGSSKEDK